jgi:hypothetical protein
MPKIYDNIKNPLSKGLNETLEVSSRTDLCVGYFNLRGWQQIGDQIDKLCGEKILEGDDEVHRYSRPPVGMQKLPIDIIKEHFSYDETHMLDQAEAVKMKKRLAQEFKEQLTIGVPTEADEKALRHKNYNSAKCLRKTNLTS